MGLADWLRPPGRTLAVFLGLMLILGIALGWLGWQWLKQDRALEKQRAQERLELAADQMAVALQQDLAALESFMSLVPGPGAEEPPDGVIVLQAAKGAFQVSPSGSLLFFPVLPATEEPSPTIFALGETFEFQRNDPVRAAETFRELARSPDPGIRAGALIRLGRNLRKIGRQAEALQAYDHLAALGETAVFGLPAELLAREARATVLEAMGKSEDLEGGRSSAFGPLERPLEPAPPRLGVPCGRGATLVGDRPYDRKGAPCALAFDRRGVGARPMDGRAPVEGAPDPEVRRPAGHDVLDGDGRPSGRGPGEARLPGLKMETAVGGTRVQGAMIDANGDVLLGSFNASGPQAVRTAAASRLPGILQTTPAGSGDEATGALVRRRLLLLAFAVLGLALIAGSYFITRSIGREQSVARLQSEFVSAVSHEFRTPLTSLRQLSEMLAKGRVPTEDARQKTYEFLSGESERLQKLVESLLDFGRVEADAFGYRLEPLDPAAFVRDLTAEFREKAGAQGYRLDLRIDAAVPPIQVDREALGLALRNLLDNAVKYSPDCRTVWVEASREGDRLAFRVRDQGMGIPASEQKEIFKRFVRGSGSKAAHIQGTGIGLAMARRIVAAHGGEIRLESVPGKGSTFTVLLPLEKNA